MLQLVPHARGQAGFAEYLSAGGAGCLDFPVAAAAGASRGLGGRPAHGVAEPERVAGPGFRTRTCFASESGGPCAVPYDGRVHRPTSFRPFSSMRCPSGRVRTAGLSGFFRRHGHRAVPHFVCQYVRAAGPDLTRGHVIHRVRVRVSPGHAPVPAIAFQDVTALAADDQTAPEPPRK